MKKILIFAFPFVLSTVAAQEEPLFKLFDVQMFGGGYLTNTIALKPSDWQKLNPDGFPQKTTPDQHSQWFRHRDIQGGDLRTLQVQFGIRKNNAARKGLWLAGISVGASTSNYAGESWNNRSQYAVLDTVSFSSGAPSQLLIGDTLNNTWRELNVRNAHLGFSIGYTTNPSRLVSFRVRALLDVSVSTRSRAAYGSYTYTRQGLFNDTVNAGQNLDASNNTNSYTVSQFSSYSTNSVFGVGLQIPVGISWQLSSFRPILSRFSLGLEMAGGIRMVAVPTLGAYTVPTFSIGANFAYRFKTWIPDNDNIRKIREKQKTGMI